MTSGALRIAVPMDMAFSTFQEEPKQGISRYFAEEDIDAVYFGLGELNPLDGEDMAKAAFFDFIGKSHFDGISIVSTSLIDAGGAQELRDRL